MLWSGWALTPVIAYQTVRPQNISMRWPQAPSGWGILLNVNLPWDPFQRSCDSRNLNLEPLCTLETGPLPKLWLEEVVFKTFKKPFLVWGSFFKEVLGWGGLLQERQLQPAKLHQEHHQPKEKQTLWLSHQIAIWGEDWRLVSTQNPGWADYVQCMGWWHRFSQHLLWTGDCHRWDLFFQVKYFLFKRTGERDLDGTGWVCLLPRRPLWSFPWVQHGLLHRDHLLGNRETLEEFHLEI